MKKWQMKGDKYVFFAALLLFAGLACESRAAETKLLPGAPVVEMIVSPAAEPQPAMRYLFLPDVLEEEPGNAALLYYQAILQMQSAGLMQGDDRKLLDLPVDQWPEQRAKELLNPEGPMKLIRQATLRPDCDWGYLIEQEGIAARLTGLSEFGRLGRLAMLHARHATAKAKVDEAIRQIGTLLAMAHHQEQGPTLIQALVGTALADEALKTTRLLIQQQDSPNLYWALTHLPRPLVSMRPAIQFERQMLFMDHPQLDRISAASTPAELQQAAHEVEDLLANWPAPAGQGHNQGQSGEPSDRTRRQIKSVIVAMTLYPHARQWLIEQGFTPEQAAAMPVAQAVGLYTLSRYEYWRDEIFKNFSLPYHEAHARLRETELAASRASAEAFPMSQLLPSVSRAAFVSARLDRQAAMLRAVEAIRMHVAEHGQLPATLADVTIVPVPQDPMLGRPFDYQADGRMFTLAAAAPQHHAPIDGIIYRVTVRPAPAPGNGRGPGAGNSPKE